MPRNELTAALLRGLGTGRSRRNVLSNPLAAGPSIDSVPSMPSVLNAAEDGNSGISEQVAQLSAQLNQLQSAQQSHLLGLAQEASTTNSSSSSAGGGGSLGTTVAGLASSFLGGGFGLSSVIGGLEGLFGGGGSSQPAPLIPYTLPSSIQYLGGVDGPGGGVTPMDYGQNGVPRPVANSSAQGNSGSTAQGMGVQITVNTMDSQSFLDNSDQIAQAVRQALLNSSSLNDVITSL